MASHRVSTDRHLVGVSGEVGIDEFGQLRPTDGQTERHTVSRECAKCWGQKSLGLFKPHLLGDIGVHAVVILPWLLGGIHIEPSTSSKVPAVLLTLDVAATWCMVANGEKG